MWMGRGRRSSLYGFETLVDRLLFGGKIVRYIAVPVCVNRLVDRVRRTRTVVGFGPVRVTQGGFRKSTRDFEEVSAV